MEKKYGVLSSSQDPQSLSMTVKGILVALAPVIISVLSMAGFNVAPETIMDLINAVFALVSGVMVVWGLVRKIKNSK